MVRSYFLSVVLTALFSTVNAFSQDESPTELIMEPIHVAMFKNGVGLVTAKAELPSSQGKFRVHPLPDASMGSFWLRWEDGMHLQNITATQAKTTTRIPTSTIPDLLEANIGNNAWIKFKKDFMDNGVNRYKIIDIPLQSAPQPIYPKEDRILPPQVPRRGEIVLLESLSDSLYKKLAVPIHHIEALMFDEDTAYDFEKHKLEQVIEFDVNADENHTAETSSVYVTYLANGITWSPSYIIDITEKENARFSAKSVIMNDLIPLEKVTAELIAGFPHIQFSDKPSAFSLAQIQEVVNDSNKEFHLGDSIVQSQGSMGRSLLFAAAPSMPSTPVAGEQTEDLYFYRLDEVTLKKGERGYFPLFAADIPYEHIFTWDIPSFIDRNNIYRQDLIEAPQEVWHSIKLTNTHSQPWTTAPAMVMKNNRVLGQDTIRYTSSQSETELKITQALDIQAEINEYETKRQRSDLEHQRRVFDLVEVKGTVAVTNYKSEPVKIKISKIINGEVLNADLNPLINKLAEGLRSVNSTSEIRWEADLEPGLENQLKIEYSYEVYVQG